MKSTSLIWVTFNLVLFISLSIPLQVAAQQTRYKLVDLGTLGGPASYLANGFDGILNNRGTLVGWADTPAPDLHPSTCSNADCFVSHAFQWRNGVLSDLGALPGGGSSIAVWIAPNGLIAGVSQIGETDPSIPGGPAQVRAVLWRNSQLIDLGLLPEGGYDTLATAVNSRGQVVGWGLDTTLDPFSLAAPGFFSTETRAFSWENGLMQDIGTLGGSDAVAVSVNQAGQVTGYSYTNSSPNTVTDIPTVDPFIWHKGVMLDLGTLGGTFGSPSSLNNRGQVVGNSNLVGDLTSHPFLWTRRTGIQDLGTLGGDNGVTNWINDAGEIVGKADLGGASPQNHDAVLWRNGTMIDLGTLPGDSCSNAYQVNSSGQIVGTSESRELCLIPTGEHAFLWENGGPMVDLNTLIPPNSPLQLTFAVAINDRGEIAGFGTPAGCAPGDVEVCGHAYVLIPCNRNGMDCRYVPENADTAVDVSSRTLNQRQVSAHWPQSMVRGRPIFGERPGHPKFLIESK